MAAPGCRADVLLELFQPSSAFWKRPAWDFSALASVSNHSAISGEALVARALGHARVHLGVLVGLARDGGRQVQSTCPPIGLSVAGSPTCFR